MVRSSTTVVSLGGMILILTLFLPITSGRPHDFVSRDRRSGISDQRLAELETLMALSRLKGYGKTITRPIAFGIIDANKIGRKKRNSRSKRHDLNKNVILVLPNDEDENEVHESVEDHFYRDMVKDDGTLSGFTLKMSSSMPSVSMLQMTNDRDEESKLYLE